MRRCGAVPRRRRSAGPAAARLAPRGTGDDLRERRGRAGRRPEQQRRPVRTGAGAQDRSTRPRGSTRVRLAQSGAYLADADAALTWAATREWAARGQGRRTHDHASIPTALPREFRRRMLGRIIRKLATEGAGELRGRQRDRLLRCSREGKTATLRGVLCRRRRAAGDFAKAPKRSARPAPPHGGQRGCAGLG